MQTIGNPSQTAPERHVRTLKSNDEGARPTPRRSLGARLAELVSSADRRRFLRL
jgi:hypothetical protein